MPFPLNILRKEKVDGKWLIFQRLCLNTLNAEARHEQLGKRPLWQPSDCPPGKHLGLGEAGLVSHFLSPQTWWPVGAWYKKSDWGSLSESHSRMPGWNPKTYAWIAISEAHWEGWDAPYRLHACRFQLTVNADEQINMMRLSGHPRRLEPWAHTSTVLSGRQVADTWSMQCGDRVVCFFGRGGRWALRLHVIKIRVGYPIS